MKIYRLPKSSMCLWTVRSALLTGAVCAVFYWFAPYRFIRAYALPTIIGIGAIITFVYLPLFLSSYKVTVNESSIWVDCGVIFKTQYIMPNKRTVYMETVSLPLDRIFSLSGLLIHASRGVCIVLQLKNAHTEQIKECLK